MLSGGPLTCMCGPGNVTGVDVVAQRDIGIARRAHVAHGLVKPASSVILAKRTPLSASRTASVEKRVVRVEIVGESEVRVDVDQSG